MLARSTSPSREHFALAFVLLGQGRVEEALAEANADGPEWAKLEALAIIQWSRGQTRDSNEALAQLERKYGDTAAFQVAQVHAARGEFDSSFEWLERAYEGCDAGVALARVATHLKPLHVDPRWPQFMRRIGLES